MYGMVPFRRRNNVQRKEGDWDFPSLLDDFFNDGFFPAFFSTGNAIKADIRETEKEFIVEAEIPGAKKDEIKLDLDENSLTISVERDEEDKEEKANYLRRERRYGSCSRSFYVNNINQDDVKAEYKDGILKVTMPKLEPSKPKKRKIDIN